uniref:Peptidase inhibitor 3 n=1 Tax=Rousettus aegyptiacus TaxID=9407 RepID=A0A7J8DK16_ROUAE|nr:peptidase inhibitor 3 [Rousettus aegyptiacus]
MRSSSFLVLAVFLVLGMLAAQAAVIGVPYKGQEAGRRQVLPPQVPLIDLLGPGPVIITKAGSCPVVQIRCAMLDPPDACATDIQCPGVKKCCVGACGKACLDPQ